MLTIILTIWLNFFSPVSITLVGEYKTSTQTEVWQLNSDYSGANWLVTDICGESSLIVDGKLTRITNKIARGYAAAISPDGKYLATIYDESEIGVISRDGFEAFAKVTLPYKGIYSLDWHVQDNIAVVTGDDELFFCRVTGSNFTSKSMYKKVVGRSPWMHPSKNLMLVSDSYRKFSLIAEDKIAPFAFVDDSIDKIIGLATHNRLVFKKSEFSYGITCFSDLKTKVQFNLPKGASYVQWIGDSACLCYLIGENLIVHNILTGISVSAKCEVGLDSVILSPSADGTHLAIGLSNGRIFLYKIAYQIRRRN